MGMRTVAVLAAALGAMSGAANAQLRPTQPDKDGFTPDVTILEIMESIVMPAAQAVWDAVGVDVTEKGEIEKKPESEEQWAALRGAAITLVESTNSLTVAGRHAAPPGTKSENPDAELTPEKIDALLAQQRP